MRFLSLFVLLNITPAPSWARKRPKPVSKPPVIEPARPAEGEEPAESAEASPGDPSQGTPPAKPEDPELARTAFQGRLDRWGEAKSVFHEMAKALVREAEEGATDASGVQDYIDSLKLEAYTAEKAAAEDTLRAVRAVESEMRRGDIGERERARKVKRLQNAMKLKMLLLFGNRLPRKLDEAVQDAEGRPAGRLMLGEGWRTSLNEMEYENYKRMEDFNTLGLEKYLPRRP